MKPLVIIGSGGQAREVAWLIADNNQEKQEWDILGFISKDREQSNLKYPTLGDDTWFEEHADPISVVCAIGDPDIRRRVTERLSQYNNIEFPVIVSRHAVCSDSVRIGEGTIVCAGSVLTTDVQLGKFVICNPNTTISHEAEIGHYVTMNAGAKVSGNVHVGDGAYLGVNACTLQGITIGHHAIIGAGATVICDLPDHCTAVGVPAKVIKRNGERVAEIR